MRFARTVWCVIATVGAALLLAPAVADAHAVLEETNPADGAVLEVAPPEVRLRFSEIVSVRDGAVKVIGPDGDPIAVGDARAVDTVVRAELPEGLADGSYVVSWRVVSADSHPIAGAFVFSVGAPTAGVSAPAVADGDSVGWQLARAVVAFSGYAGTLVAVGLSVFVVFVHDAGPERDRLLRLGQGAALLGAAGVILAIPVHVVDLAGAGLSGVGEWAAWRDVVGSSVGAAGLVTIAGLAVLCVASRTSARSVAADAVVGASATAALAGFVVAGHTRTFGPWWLVVTSDLVHLVAAAVWLGGLIGLAVTLRHRLSLVDHERGDARDVPSPTSVVARFSALAAGSLLLVAVFGVLLAWRIVGSWDVLFGSGYGAALLVKVGLVAVVAALGGYNRFRLVPTVTTARLARVVRVEAILLVAVVATTAVLVDRSPTIAASADQPPAAGEQSSEVVIALGDAATAAVTFTPGRAGDNAVAIVVRDTDGNVVELVEPPVIAATLAERDIGPISTTAVAAGGGAYEASLRLPVAGRWEIRVTARITDFEKPIGVAWIEVAE